MNESTGRLSAVLAAAGLIISIGLEVLHVRTYLDPTAASFCAVGETLDCDTVALSRFSVVLGIPLPVWGIVGFGTLSFAAARRRALLVPLTAIAATASVLMFLEEVLNVGSICLFCEAIHIISLWMFVDAWRSRDLAATKAYFKDVKTLANDLALPVVMLVAVSLFAPAYWVRVSWLSGPRLNHGVGDDGRPWMGASDPELVIHEYVDYACPHCAIASAQMRMVVGRHSGSLRLVRHQQPRMKCVPASPGSRRCKFARAAICAGQQGKFWEMEDWLFHHVPGNRNVDVEPGAETIGIDANLLRNCMDDPATFEQAEVDSKDARTLRIIETPGYVVDDEKLTPAEAHALIDERL